MTLHGVAFWVCAVVGAAAGVNGFHMGTGTLAATVKSIASCRLRDKADFATRCESLARKQRKESSTCLGSLVGKILADLEALEEAAPTELSKGSINQDTEFLERIIAVLEDVEQLQGSKEGMTELRDGVVGKKSDHQGGDSNVAQRRKVTGAVDAPAPAMEWAKEVGRQQVLGEIQDDEDEDNPHGSSIFRAGFFVRLLRGVVGQSNGPPIRFTTYPRHAEFPKYDLSGMMKMAEGAPQPQYIFSPRKFIRLLIRYIRADVGQRMATRATNRASSYEQKHKAFFSPPRIFFGLFENPFNLFPRPAFAMAHFERDVEFARQFLAGVNPVMIRVCHHPRRLLTRPLLDFFERQKVNVHQLAREDRLLYVSYEELADMENNPHDAYPEPYNSPKHRPEPRPYHAAIGVFALEPTKRMEMDILAIQLDSHDDDDEAQVFSRDTCKDRNEWLMAKTCLAAADSQYHEWVSHLGNTHMTFEPHFIAIHNTLKMENHPVFVFLEPLLRDTLFLNWAARRTLAAYEAESFGDRVTSVGVGQYMQLIHKRWQSYDFFESSALPQELQSRGFTEDFHCPGYLYREDGLHLWEAIGEFATNFVDEVYATDKQVRNDKGLQRWAKETTKPSKGAVPGFPKRFRDKPTLASVLQTLLWITSGLHAAVNFPQYDYLAYAPNKPLGQRCGMKQYQEEGSKAPNPREWIFRQAMPYVEIAKEVAMTVRILTLPSERCLDQLEDHFDQSPGKASYQKFLAKLDAIGDVIEARNARNKAAGRAVYSYLNPSVVPVSIDI